MKQIKVGVLVNTHGLKGEVKIKPMTDFPDIRFRKGSSINIQYQSSLISVKVKHMRVQKDMLLVCFEGFDDINQVEAWKGSTLSIDEDQLHELDENEVYFFELKDCEVYDTNQQYLGIVTEIIETGANAILRVKGEREYLIPYVKAFIQEMNKEEKRICVKLVDGL